jgi:hypothetical protein
VSKKLNTTKYKTDKKIKFIISLTTSPTRMKLMNKFIKNLTKQTYKPEYVLLNIPRIFERTGEKYDIPNFPPSIIVNYLNVDYGPVCKLAGAISYIKKNENIFIVYLDDDILYPNNMLEIYVQYIEKFGNTNAFALSLYYGRLFPEGFASVCVHRSFFSDDFLQFIKFIYKHKDCKYSDDILIGHYLHKKNIKLIKIKPKDNKFNRDNILQNCLLDYGLKEDAIHQGASGVIKNGGQDGHKEKYKRCLKLINNFEFINNQVYVNIKLLNSKIFNSKIEKL